MATHLDLIRDETGEDSGRAIYVNGNFCADDYFVNFESAVWVACAIDTETTIQMWQISREALGEMNGFPKHFAEIDQAACVAWPWQGGRTAAG